MSNNQNVKGALCYLLGWITGIFFLLTEKQDKFIRFHAAQSIITFGILFVLGFVLGPLAVIADFLAWIFLMYQAYQGKEYKLPVIGDFAEKLAGNTASTPPAATK